MKMDAQRTLINSLSVSRTNETPLGSNEEPPHNNLTIKSHFSHEVL